MRAKNTLFCVLLVIGLGTVYGQTSKKSRPRPVAPASAAENDKDISKEVFELEDTQRRAALAGDSTWWDLHLDENYIGTDADGRTTTKTEAIQLHNSPDLKYDNIHLSDMSIRTYNRNTVIINGKSDIDGTFKGQNIGGSYSFVRVWIKEATAWKLAASSLHRIPAKP